MKRLLWILPALVLIVGGWWLYQRQSVPEVSVAQAERGTAVDAVTGTVEIFANADLKVSTEREGRLAEMLVKAGDVVEKDQLLARQDSLELEYRIEQERVRLAAAEARLALPLMRGFDVEGLEDEVEAVRLEVELGQASVGRLEQMERELRKRQALLREEEIQRQESAGVLRARVKEMELELDKMQIRAPFAGEIVEAYAVEGNQLGRNANLVRLVAPKRWAEMVLNEEDFDGAAVGQRVILRLASYGNREFRGEVTRLSRTADADEKTRKLFLEIEADRDVLIPGLTGEGYLVKEEREDAVLVPRRALRGRRVWVVSDGLVEERTVTPGFLSLHRAEILDGLEAGEAVVLENQQSLSDGQRVRVRPR